jgi:hypothetical protein
MGAPQVPHGTSGTKTANGIRSWKCRITAASLPTIGFLDGQSASAMSHLVAAFVQRLRELGWIEGRNIAIEYRWVEGRNERAAEVAAEFVRLKVDIIVTAGTTNIPVGTGSKQPATDVGRRIGSPSGISDRRIGEYKWCARCQSRDPNDPSHFYAVRQAQPRLRHLNQGSALIRRADCLCQVSGLLSRTRSNFSRRTQFQWVSADWFWGR